MIEQLDYNLLFRWFVGLSIDDPVWDATVFCKNRDRLLDGDIAAKFFVGVLNLPQVRALLSSITSRSMASARAGVAFLRPVGTLPRTGFQTLWCVLLVGAAAL